MHCIIIFENIHILHVKKKKTSLSILATFQHIKKNKKKSDMKNKIDEKKHMTVIKRRNTQLSNYNWILMLSALPRRNILTFTASG